MLTCHLHGNDVKRFQVNCNNGSEMNTRAQTRAHARTHVYNKVEMAFSSNVREIPEEIFTDRKL